VWDSHFVTAFHANEQSKSDDLIDSTSNGYDGTRNSYPEVIAGKIDGARHFTEGDNDAFRADSYASNTPTTMGTVELWLYREWTDSDSGSKTLVEWRNDSNNHISMGWAGATLDFRFIVEAGGAYDRIILSPSVCPQDSWCHFVMTWNHSANYIKGYVNGTQKGTDDQNGVFSGIVSIWRYGENYAGGGDLNGSLDEIRISDIPRSADWINMSYQIMANQDTLVSFDSEETNTLGVSYNASFSKTITDGNYVWNCLAYDNESQSSWASSNRTITIDTTPPTPNPAVMAEINPDSTSQVTATSSQASDPLSYPVYYLFNETTGNTGSSNSSWQTSRSFVDDSLATNTLYCYYVKYKDSVGNEGTASDQICNATLAEQPTISSVVCEYNSGYVCTTTFSMGSNPSSTERYINETTGNSGSADSAWSTSASPYVDSGLAAHTEYCYRIKARNMNLTETAYTSTTCDTMENIVPTITSVTSNASVSKEGNTINMTSSGASDGDGDALRLSCGSSTENYNLCNGTYIQPESSCTFQFPWTDDTTHTVYCRVEDQYGGNSSEVTLSILADNTPPTGFTFVSPTQPNGTENVSSVDWYYVNVTFTETRPDTCILEDGSSNTTMTRDGGNCFINMTGQDTGTHIYRVYANDTVGNINVSEDKYYIINSKPSIISNSTYPDIPNSDEDITFNVTCSDKDYDDTLTVYVQPYLNNVKDEMESSASVTNGTSSLAYTYASGNFSSGDSIIFEFWCGDGLENSTKYNTSTLTVDDPPDIILSQPSDGSTDTDGSVTFKCNVTDDNKIKNITLYGNWSGIWHANETKEGSNETSYNFSAEDNIIGKHGDSCTDYLASNMNNGPYPDYCTYSDETSNSVLDSHDSNELNCASGAPPDIFITQVNISDNENNVTLINWTSYMRAGTSVGNQVNYYIWNDTGGTWYKCASDLSKDQSDWRYCTINESQNPADFINSSGSIHFAATGPTYNDDFYVDYSAVVIESSNFKTSYNATFTKTITDGNYVWNCLAYDNQSQEEWASSNRTISLDTTAPTITSNSTSPAQVTSTTDVSLYITCEDRTQTTPTAYVQPYLNNVKDETESSASVTNGTSSLAYTYEEGNFSSGDSIIFEFWCGDGYHNTSKYNATVIVVDDPPSVTLSQPPDNGKDSDGSVTFKCNVTDDNDIKNITLYGNWSGGWHANETVDITGDGNVSYNATFTKTITDGNYVWNCLAYDNESQEEWADSNRTIRIGSSAPYITSNETRPVDAYTNNDITLNVTCSDENYDDTLTVYIQPYLNNAEDESESSSVVQNGTNTLIYTYASGNFSKGDTVIFEFWCGDGTVNTSKYNTTEITIKNTLPPKVSLSYPDNGDDTFTNRTPKFNWTDVTDTDGDTITYQLLLCLDSSCSSIYDNITSISTNHYYYPSELGFTTYFWKVRANDSEDYGTWSDIWNFTVVEYVDVNLTTALVDFGVVAPGSTYATDDGTPPPFILKNIGNTEANITINATALWESSSAPLDTDYYQFKANRTSGLNSFDWDLSQTTWMNISSDEKTVFAYLNHTEGNDEAAIDIRIKVPQDEPAIDKYSNVTVYYGIA